MIKLVKYQFAYTIADDIAKLMDKYLLKIKIKGGLDKNFLLVPVPLDKKRRAWRGFNQSEIICDFLSKQIPCNYAKNILAKKSGLTPQVHVAERNSRLANVVGAFGCLDTELVKNKNILLVDDVATTCATLNDCARALKSAGARYVAGFAFARN
ncbi:MAG: putative amidophosphoribosyltransferase [Parcubacteria group bacterium Licking1014_17]|nr:MAG: putative amidophosphoribosyltransferase [Parcubacteria group bacterium Licking1014_17]